MHGQKIFYDNLLIMKHDRMNNEIKIGTVTNIRNKKSTET